MPTFLALHAHWLWAFLHAIHHPYSGWTLGLFVFVGILQTLVAIFGGELAVEALPDNARAVRRGTFILLGVALLVATFWTGLLNDKSQKETDGRAKDLADQLTGLSNSVITTEKLHAEIQNIPRDATSTSDQKQLISRYQLALDQSNKLAQQYATVQTKQQLETSSLVRQTQNLQTLSNAEFRVAIVQFCDELRADEIAYQRNQDQRMAVQYPIDYSNGRPAKEMTRDRLQMARRQDDAEMLAALRKEVLPKALIFQSEIQKRTGQQPTQEQDLSNLWAHSIGLAVLNFSADRLQDFSKSLR